MGQVWVVILVEMGTNVRGRKTRIMVEAADEDVARGGFRKIGSNWQGV